MKTQMTYKEIPHDKKQCNKLILEGLTALVESSNKVKRLRYSIFIMGELKHLL